MVRSTSLASWGVIGAIALVLMPAGCGDYEATLPPEAPKATAAAPSNAPAGETPAPAAAPSDAPAGGTPDSATPPNDFPPGEREKNASNCLKQIALGLHNYAFAHKTFPPAYTTDDSGKPLLSWRVLILPYQGEEKLYGQFHLGEPWDSEHNKKLVARMPSFYKDLDSKLWAQGKTNFLTVRGEKSVFPGKDGIAIADIADGTSNTVMLVEVSDEKAVVWTKPDDFEYDEANPYQGLTGLRPDGFLVGFADASVRLLKPSIDPVVLKALFTRNGGEAISADNN